MGTVYISELGPPDNTVTISLTSYRKLIGAVEESKQKQAMKTRIKLIIANIVLFIPAVMVLVFRIYVTLFHRG